MKNEILDELWKAKDEIGKECHYDLMELARMLRKTVGKAKKQTVDLSDSSGRHSPPKKKAA